MSARTTKFLEATRERAKWVRDNASGVYRPRTPGDRPVATWPVCATCNRDVDSVEVVDFQPGMDRVTVRAKCHGAEAVVKFDFPYSIQRRDPEREFDSIQTAINACVFFPTSIA